jgi:lipocalin
MTNLSLLLVPLLIFASPTLGQDGDDSCPVVETVPNFDIETYASDKWYSQKQAENGYQSLDDFNCVTAEYEVRSSKTFWGYTVDVLNTAQNDLGSVQGGELCAYQTGTGDDASKLAVAPCFLPRTFAGPYWIVAYDETEGYALISGGQPTIPAPVGLTGCRTGTGVNNSGLWIFTRSRERDDDLINRVIAIAKDAGFDTSILFDVDQSSCEEVCEDTDEGFRGGLFGYTKDCDWVASFTGWRCLFHNDQCPETCGNCAV